MRPVFFTKDRSPFCQCNASCSPANHIEMEKAGEGAIAQADRGNWAAQRQTEPKMRPSPGKPHQFRINAGQTVRKCRPSPHSIRSAITGTALLHSADRAISKAPISQAGALQAGPVLHLGAQGAGRMRRELDVGHPAG